ncbi:helix-turn-helix transcriptional regulator [Trueperella pyogenes]|uniref:Uncharacterized protein n=1 Tax=Trueperella pyogenes TaxID=1661 RepID=A0A3Q9GJ21_9ACTO|nr:hypothetical protein [Trueperella pyogenes]AHU90601.1 hypothetical protein CQ11_08855 [Trueperella pyogenes]AWG03460.1 hypothetical protein DC090_02860 [Trueperella pyogenes]AWG16191.1 hypothetical protein DDE06_04785 [Trueperella pyogenes]AZR05073.1 hypothetical protein EBQ11_07390 [Trueperella pyogenes]AZR07348.1 hypothetical protein EBQ10_08650 [Trueperella pyogenes]
MPYQCLLQEIGISHEAGDAYFDGIRLNRIPSDPAIIEELISAGLARQTDEGLIFLSASATMRAMLNEREEALARARLLLADLVSFETLVNQGFKFSSSDADIHQWHERVTFSAEKSLYVFDRPPYLSVSNHIAPATETLEEREVEMKAIYQRSQLVSDEFVSVIKESIAHGEIARIHDHLPFRMLIADHRIALIMWKSQSLTRSILVTDYTIIELLTNLFFDIWKRSFEIRLPSTKDAFTTPSSNSVDILSLLALGIPDGAIAKRLRISERTVGRRIKELADSLGVDTRFQIGVEAARRGLI